MALNPLSKGKLSMIFNVECAATKPGEAVFIVGSLPELGAWDARKAVRCTATAKSFPGWTSEVLPVASSGDMEFKMVVQPVDAAKQERARWEGGANRKLQLQKSLGDEVCVSVQCTWGVPEVIHKASRRGEGLQLMEAAHAPEDSNRVDNGDGDESDDDVGELVSMSSRSQSKQSLNLVKQQGPISDASQCHLGVRRNSSRHLCMNSDGGLNPDMSRTPSLMMVDVVDLEEDCAKHEEEVVQLERERLNAMQRRMNSGHLLESMRHVIDKADKSSQVMLQGFNWESWRGGSGDWYGVVGEKVEMLQEMGVTDIWLPPPSASVAPQGYLPSQLFNLDGSKYGSQASLEALIQKLHNHSIRAVADIVVNHRCGDKQDNQGRWNQFTGGMVNRPSFNGIMDWGGWAITIGDRFSDGTGQNHPGKYDSKFDAAPDIDHANEKVRQSISIWLRWLQLQVGFDAWRFDFVKGYAAEFVGHYCRKSAPSWAVGELWCDAIYDEGGLAYNQDKNRQDLVNWVHATGKESTAFDFTTKAILQEACRNCEYWRLKDKDGKPPGMIGWMPRYAVTFIDNHDTGSTQRHWPFPDDKVLVGYAYILTHPGIPSLFWDHVMDWGEHCRNQISALLKARRDSGISVDAPVKILCADRDLYMAEIGSPPVLRVALGPRSPGNPDGGYWSSGPAGNNYHVWVHKTHAAPMPAKVPKPTTPAPKQKPVAVAATATGRSDAPNAARKAKGRRKASSSREAVPQAAVPAASQPAPQVEKPAALPTAPPETIASIAPLAIASVAPVAVAAGKAVTAVEEAVPLPAAGKVVDATIAVGEETAAAAVAVAAEAAAAVDIGGTVALPPIMVDGMSLTLEALNAMEPPELERLAIRLEQVAKAARGVRASMQ